MLNGILTMFSAIFRSFFTKTLDPSQKTWRSVNKNNEKNGSQTYFRMIFRKNFEKKIEIFQKKNFFGSCYFIFRHGEKKKFFFRKNFDQNFGPKFYFYFCKGIVFFQKKINFFNFFSLLNINYTPKNGFRPRREGFSHISTL